jgi:tetratricopeptide (TPR) repeat protein
VGLYDESEPLTLADKVSRVQKAWQETTPRLLIFDNCEAETLLADWLPVTGGCRVLLTSRKRHWSRQFEISAIPLNVLNNRESVSLLQRLVPQITEAEAIEVAKEVGHLPLPLHLAGGFLSRYRQISPAQYLTQLRDKGLLQHPSLQGRGLSFSPTAHELNVGRTFALNMDQLKPGDEVDAIARQLLVCAACFAPGEPIPQAALLATVIEDENNLMAILSAEDGLARLITLGFLDVQGGETVVLHRLLAAFILEEVATDPLIKSARKAAENAIIQLSSNFLETANLQAPLPISAIHLRHITESALLTPSRRAGQLALILGQQLRHNGKFPTAWQLLEKGLAASQAAEDLFTQGCITYVLARVLFSQGKHQEALQQAKEAERLLVLADSPAQNWLFNVLDRQSWANVRLGRADAAFKAAEAARQLAIQHKSQSLLLSSLNLLGSIKYFLMGEYETADNYFEEAITLARNLDDQYTLATILSNLAQSAADQGNYQRARELIQEGLTMMRDKRERVKELAFLINLSEIQVRMREPGAAIANLEQVIAQAPDYWTYKPMAYYVLAEAYLGSGEVEQALETIRLTFTLVETGDDPYFSGQIWRVLGLVAAQRGESVTLSQTEDGRYDAPACFAKSLTIFTEIENERERAIVLWTWGDYELAAGDRAKGEALRQEAYNIFKRLRLALLVEQMEM